MFAGDKDDTKLTPFGYIVLALALPVALWMCARSAWPGSKLPGPEVMGMGWEPRCKSVRERCFLVSGEAGAMGDDQGSSRPICHPGIGSNPHCLLVGGESRLGRGNAHHDVVRTRSVARRLHRGFRLSHI